MLLSCLSYSLLGALSTLLKEEMQPFLEEIVKEMHASVVSTEGITVSCYNFLFHKQEMFTL